MPGAAGGWGGHDGVVQMIGGAAWRLLHVVPPKPRRAGAQDMFAVADARRRRRGCGSTVMR